MFPEMVQNSPGLVCLWPFPPHSEPRSRVRFHIFISGTVICSPRGHKRSPTPMLPPCYLAQGIAITAHSDHCFLPPFILWKHLLTTRHCFKQLIFLQSHQSIKKPFKSPNECGLPLNSSVREMPPQPFGHYNNNGKLQ